MKSILRIRYGYPYQLQPTEQLEFVLEIDKYMHYQLLTHQNSIILHTCVPRMIKLQEI